MLPFQGAINETPIFAQGVAVGLLYIALSGRGMFFKSILGVALSKLGNLGGFF
jgi:hypothetical protein